MTMSVRWLTVSLITWILWMDQTVYPGPRHGHVSSAGEAGSSSWEQLAVLPTKVACEAIRRDRIQEAAQRDAADGQRGRYPERFRFFCSPAAEDPDR